MRIYDLVDDETKRKLNAAVRRPAKRKTKKQRYQEQLTENDYKFFMGMYRDKYHKVNGKVRRK